MIARGLSVALAGALLTTCLQTWRLAAEQRDHADTKAKHAQQVARLSETARQAEADARAEEQRRTAEVQKAADEAEKAKLSALADSAAARTAGERLRAQLATIASSCRAASRDSGAANSGTSTISAADLLADVQRRLDEAADGIAAHADAARAAGHACERSYDALRRK